MPGRHVGEGKSISVKDILNVTIIGGSISGLACAFALAKAGHRVIVLEATDGRNTRCGAVKLPPNGTLCLNRWGLKTLLGKYSQKFLKYSYMHTEYDNLVGTLQLNELLQHEAFLNQDISDYTFSLDSDLWNWLFKLATDSGVTFRPNSRVVDIDSSKPSVTLQNGDTVVSDFIVGADGINGIARSVVSGRSLDPNGPRFLTAACTLPCDDFHRDPDLASVLNETVWLVWGGDGVRLQGQVGVSKSAKTYTLTLEYQIPDDVTLDPSMKVFGWCDTFKLQDLKFIDYKKFSGRALKLLNLAKGARTFMNIHVEQPVLDELVCDNERLVLVGDAAHGIAPANQHNAALGLEDAEALGSLFSRIQSHTYVPRFIMAFEEIRGPRIAHGSKVDMSLKYSHVLPEGARRERFDEFFAAAAERAADQPDEEYLSLLWNETLSMWLYDTSEKVEDWLTKWGVGMTREFRENDKQATLVFVDRNISHQ